MTCFHFCNPFCGRCKPATKKLLNCPSCGGSASFDREDIIAGTSLSCPHCGLNPTELARPIPVFCNHSGLVCAYPCGKSLGKKPGGGYLACSKNVPFIPQ